MPALFRRAASPAHRATGACTLLSGALLLAACATPGEQYNALRQEAATRAGLAAEAVTATGSAAIRARVDEITAQPLTREDAVTVALLNNPQLARRFAQLRIDNADRVRASRPPNPSLTLARLQRGSERETERGISINLLGLLTWPAGRGGANRQFDAAHRETLRDALAVARDTRIAWVDALAADAALRYAAAVRDAADTGRLYAERLAQTGNASRLDATRAQAFYAEADIALADAQHAANAAREHLAVLLGLDNTARLQLPAQLPELPVQPLAQTDAEQRAVDNRADVQAARLHAQATARALALQRSTRMVNVLDAGYMSNTANQAPDQTGFEVTLELPLFDFGSASNSEARARYDAALAEVAAVANAARSETRLAWARYRAAHESARRYRDDVLPLTADITREMVLRHNGMLVGPFELLEQARAQAAATARWQQALRNFWIADAQLAAALDGAGSSTASATQSPAGAATPALGH
jgi:outer membrane protein TolC